MADFKDKISNLINSQVPDFVLEDHPLFLDFVKAYYQLMESAEITLTNIGDPDHLVLEGTTAAKIVLDGTNVSKDDGDDNVLLEDTSYGDFINGETITGSTSGATTTVIIEDVDGGGRLFVAHQNKFVEGELITGSSSGAEATIGKYRANPVQNIQQLLDYADVDKTISGFLSKFRNAFLTSVPDRLYEGIDKRNLTKNIKSLYQSKGTKRASEIFFKLLLNEDAEIRYPKDEMLRVSDGKWDTKKIIRCLALGTSEPTNLIGQTITQANNPVSATVNEATAIVEDVFKFLIGGVEVTELVVGDDSVSGTFVAGETITGTDNTDDDVLVSLSVSKIIDEKTITNDGALYNEDDTVEITAGGSGASVKIGTIGPGTIQEVLVDTGGSGYAVGDNINFGSGNATAKVSVVNGGVTLESGTGTGQLILEDETGKNDQYFGNKVVQEEGSGNEDITDIRMIEFGNGYTSLPSVTVTSSGGSGAKLLAYGSEIGRALTMKVIESGYNYQASPAPTIKLPTYILYNSLTGGLTAGETITGGTSSVTAEIVSVDTTLNIVKAKNHSGSFVEGETITGGNGGTFTALRLQQATGTLSTGTVVTTDGTFINEDGWVSENSMKVQDSLLYQDYSYIIKVGRSINEWRDAYVKTLHSAGFYFQGEIAIQTSLNAQIKRITGLNSGVEGILKTLLTRIYSKLIGRRLGTESDGTSLRANANEVVAADFDTDTVTQFSKTTRDVTLKTQPLVIDYVSRVRRTINNVNVRQGFVYAGPRFGTINKMIQTAFGLTANGTPSSSGITFEQLSAIKVKGTRTSLDGTGAIFLMTSSEEGRKIKTNFTIPAQIGALQGDTFDETQTKFDSGNVKFDVG
nr:putative structural protein [uncultured Mediterranean phage uvMED]